MGGCSANCSFLFFWSAGHLAALRPDGVDIAAVHMIQRALQSLGKRQRRGRFGQSAVICDDRVQLVAAAKPSPAPK